MSDFDESNGYEDYSGDEKLPGLAREIDPVTSHEAADKIDTTRLCGIVYGVIAKYGDRGCIGEQVIQALPYLRPQSVSPRFAQMIDMGMLEDTMERRVASSGYRQIVRRVKLPPFVGQHRGESRAAAAVNLLRDFPESGSTEAWNLKRKQFLSI